MTVDERLPSPDAPSPDAPLPDAPLPDDLLAGLDHVRRSPADEGVLRLVVRRPRPADREVVDVATLDPVEGVVGDCWRTRGCRLTPDGSADPDRQLALMNARVIGLIAGAGPEAGHRWALAGDQLYVDLDLSTANLPAGQRLRVGTAVVEITDAAHRGCAKFTRRFGRDATRFVNTAPDARQLRLRGVHARVIEGGTAGAGDRVVKLP